MKKILMSLLSIMVLSCQQDDEVQSEPNPSQQELNLGSNINRDFSGIITDQTGNPLSMVSVSIGSTTTLTDVNGVFRVNNAPCKEKLAFVKASKPGYMSASRSLVPTNGINNVYIKMLPSTVIATIPSGSEQTVTLGNGSALVFPGGFKDENGNTYSGNVAVSAYHLEKSNPDISKIMPGMLFAQTTSNEARALETYGMMNVELKGASGQKLQPSAAVTMKMKIDPSQTSVAPATIPLWHFDETKGYWVEEGSATKQGNEYVGSVNHFSWWNCDQPFPQVTLTVTLQNNAGAPLAGVSIGITRASQPYPAMGITSSSGVCSGIVPANESLLLQVFPQGCNTPIYSQTIGPLSSNTTLPVIVLNPSSNVATITGNLLDCSNNPVTNGYVILKNNGNYILQNVTSGSFNFSVIFCTPTVTFSVEGYDASSNQIAPEVNYTMASSTAINLGNVLACTAVTEFISWTVNGSPTQTVISNISAALGNAASPTGISIQGGVAGNIFIRLNNTSLGNYTTSTTNFFEGNSLGYSATLSAGNLPASPVVFTLNNWPAVGGYIDINFSGDYYAFMPGTNIPVLKTVQGTAHVIRDN